MTVARKIADTPQTKPKPAPKPPAAQRTLSLFTGRTDLDDPTMARDGTLPQEKPRTPRIPRRKWEGSDVAGRWSLWSGSGERSRELASIERKAGVYYARTTRRGELGSFASIQHATNAVEAAL